MIKESHFSHSTKRSEFLISLCTIVHSTEVHTFNRYSIEEIKVKVRQATKDNYGWSKRLDILGVREERVKSISDILVKGFDGIDHGIIKDSGTVRNFLGGLWIVSNGFIISKVDRF